MFICDPVQSLASFTSHQKPEVRPLLVTVYNWLLAEVTAVSRLSLLPTHLMTELFMFGVMEGDASLGLTY